MDTSPSTQASWWDQVEPLLLQATGSNTGSGPDQSHVAVVCTQYAALFGANQLADLFAEAFGNKRLAPATLVTLIDCLRGTNGASFPWKNVEELLQALEVDWAAFTCDGPALAEFFSSIILLAKVTETLAVYQEEKSRLGSQP